MIDKLKSSLYNELALFLNIFNSPSKSIEKLEKWMIEAPG